MDPLVASLVLFAALIAVAGAMTGLALVRPATPGPALERAVSHPLAIPSPADVGVSVSLLCPEKGDPASARLGLDRRAGPVELTVLACEHFGDGPVQCEMACLGAPVAA